MPYDPAAKGERRTQLPDFLEDKKKEINARLKELEPLVDEYRRLEAAARALEGVGGGSAPSSRASSRRSVNGTSGRGGGTGRRGRPRGTGSRANQTLQLVRETPGITIPELADKMGIKQNYLYRVLPGLEQDGMVRKQGRGWHPKEAA
jgi:MarR family protein